MRVLLWCSVGMLEHNVEAYEESLVEFPRTVVWCVGGKLKFPMLSARVGMGLTQSLLCVVMEHKPQ